MEKDCEITKHIDESEIKPNGTIYLLTNIINGKVYIGKVSRPKIFRDRLVEHLREGKKLKKLRVSNPDKKIYGTHLHNAIAKYREEVWNVRKIDIAYNKTELNQKERYWIKKYDSMNPNKGYNMTEGGESGRRRPEVVKRISKSVQELWQNKEYQEKQKNARIEMWLNNEYREHIINKCIKKWQDPIYHKNQSEKIRIGMINKWQEPEYLKIQSEKISNSMRKLWKNSKFQNKMQDYRKKMWKDPEFHKNQCEKISKAMNKLWQNPNFQRKESHRISIRMVHLWQDTEFRKSQSLSRSKAADKRWKNKEYKKRQIKAIKQAHRKEISCVKEFLTDIKNVEFSKELCNKYNMCIKTINARIEEILKPFSIKNYTGAKKFLRSNDIKLILKKIKEY